MENKKYPRRNFEISSVEIEYRLYASALPFGYDGKSL